MAKVRTRASRTDTRRTHRLSLIASFLLLLSGVGAAAVGGYAWSMPAVPATLVPAVTEVDMHQSPLFSIGSTLFADPVAAQDSIPDHFQCRLTSGDGRVRELQTAPRLHQTGTRVVDGTALEPVVTVGPTVAGETLSCDPVVKGSKRLWLLPTDPGVPRVPLSLIIGGVALIGFAALTHPRGRGIVPFGS